MTRLEAATAAEAEFVEELYRSSRTAQGLSLSIDDDPAAVELAARLLAPATAAETGDRRPVSAAIGVAGLTNRNRLGDHGPGEQTTGRSNTDEGRLREQAALQNNAG